MKTTLLALSVLVAQSSIAAPAMSYVCKGLNKANGQQVTLEVNISDFDREAGYTNQSISVAGQDGSITSFQIYGASRKNHCKKSEFGEVFLARGYKLDDDAQGAFVKLEVNCGSGFRINMQARCELN